MLGSQTFNGCGDGESKEYNATFCCSKLLKSDVQGLLDGYFWCSSEVLNSLDIYRGYFLFVCFRGVIQNDLLLLKPPFLSLWASETHHLLITMHVVDNLWFIIDTGYWLTNAYPKIETLIEQLAIVVIIIGSNCGWRSIVGMVMCVICWYFRIFFLFSKIIKSGIEFLWISNDFKLVLLEDLLSHGHSIEVWPDKILNLPTFHFWQFQHFVKLNLFLTTAYVLGCDRNNGGCDHICVNGFDSRYHCQMSSRVQTGGKREILHWYVSINKPLIISIRLVHYLLRWCRHLFVIVNSAIQWIFKGCLKPR